MSLVRYWDGSGWAYGESVFDGKRLPYSEADERFWAQREAVLGTGERAVGEFLTVKDMKKAKVEESHYRAAWRPKRKSNVQCGCGQLMWISDVKKGLKRCKTCRETGRKMRKPKMTEAA